MVEWATYPVYPAINLVTVQCLPQSTASTSSSPSSPIDVITWRALVPQETDLAYRLQKLPVQLLPERFVSVLQSENSEGRAAQERGDWKTAMTKFETCRTMISEDLRGLVPVHVEEQDFDLLLAWADLPLAELYQSRGRSDSFMLQQAMEMRKEVLRCCVTWMLGSSFWPRGDNPLPTNNGFGSSLGDSLVQVCLTYYYTARYEWGHAVNNERAKIEAVQEFANFVGCNDDEAESQLCLLLSVDYQYMGRFEDGLGWIEEADRHWPQTFPGVDEYRRILRLSKAELLIKVDKFAEALKTLEELQDTEHGKHLQSACYSQMSRREQCNGNSDQAKHYERQAKDYERESEFESLEPDALQFTFGQIPLSHPILKATPCPLGSSLGLVREDFVPVLNELRKLPVIQFGVLQVLLLQGETSEKRRDWEATTYWYERMRELLKLTARVVEKQTYDWLLTWCNLTLANIYHYHTRRFEKAHTTWEDLLSSANHQMGPANKLLLHGYRFNLAAVLFEGFGKVLNQPYHVVDGNKAHGRDTNTRKRHSCFWLYFGHHRTWNYEIALHWLRESKRLKEELNVGCPEMACSDDDYFCCDYDYLRCEADLLMKLGKFEEAINVLEKLLKTKHVQQGSRLLARQASEWLHCCRDPMVESMTDRMKAELFDPLGIWAESKTMKVELFETSSPVDIEYGYGTAEKLPSTFGCMRVPDDEIMLIQSQVGLEHHLNQLPVHLHMAFRWHGNRGSAFLKLSQWEAAIFEFEWCREILKIIKTNRIQSSEDEQVKAYDWLMVWASLPLAGIYEFRKKQLKKALDLWVEIAKIIYTVNRQYTASCDVENIEVECSSLTLLFVGRYHYSVSKYPDVKDEVVRAFGAFLREEDDWMSEDCLLTFLYNSYIVCGNYEAALPFIRQAKQVFDQHFSGHGLDYMDSLYGHVVAEAKCLTALTRLDDAAKVHRKYLVESSYKTDKAKELPERVLQSQEEAMHFAQFYEVVNDKLGEVSFIELFKFTQNMGFERFGGIWQLRMKSLEFAKNGELLKAMECYENSCVELIDKTPNEGLKGALDYKLESFDYYCLGNLHSILIHQTIGSWSYEQIKAYRKDVNLLRPVHYYEKVIELSPSLTLEMSPQLNTSLAALYDTIDEYYVCYLLNHYDQSLTESQELFFQMHCMRDDLDVLWRQSYGDILSGNYTGEPLPLQDALNEIQTFLNMDIPIDKYGEKALLQFTNLLYNMDSNSYIEGWWIGILDLQYILYKVLQNHHYRRVRCFTYLKGLGEDFQKQLETSKWNAFMSAEAERAQVMLYQQLVASNKLNSNQQWVHGAWNVHTRENIQKLCTTVLKGRSVYVQYSSIQQAHDWFFIYVIDQDGKLSIIRGGDHEEGTRKPGFEGRTRSTAIKKPLSLEKRLNNLYRYLEKGDFHNYNGDSMMKDLIFLHGLLIKPIAHILRKMKPDDNLILCPSELFTKVPFAALRDSENSQKYLIERHTISLVPSLKVLHSCNERLEELQSSHPYTGCAGSIIALGDPNYNCGACVKKFQRLEETREEVNHIATLFGETAVKKLLGQHATKEQLQFWAAKASDDSSSFRQAIVHIGAHGTIDEKHDKKIVSLQLTCDDPASSANIGVLSLSDDTGSFDEESTSEPLGQRRELESDDNSDEDQTNSGDEESDSQINMSTSKLFNVQSMLKEDVSFQETNQGASSSRSRAKIGQNVGTTQQSVALHALKVEDLRSFEWRAELVVLSACLSARGRITTEGVLSFARAFMIAGVPCVVASQWKVDDDATVGLMKAFYEELHQGKTVASALRSSMLAYMRTHRDSVGHWAPFNVWGVSSLRLPEDLLDPHRSREHPMSISPLQADLAGGEGNELQIPSTDGGEELSSSTKDSIGCASTSCSAPPLQSDYICDGCSSYILTGRWHCSVCPHSFDLCQSCYVSMVTNQLEFPPHSKDHPMTNKRGEYGNF